MVKYDTKFWKIANLYICATPKRGCLYIVLYEATHTTDLPQFISHSYFVASRSHVLYQKNPSIYRVLKEYCVIHHQNGRRRSVSLILWFSFVGPFMAFWKKSVVTILWVIKKCIYNKLFRGLKNGIMGVVQQNYKHNYPRN